MNDAISLIVDDARPSGAGRIDAVSSPTWPARPCAAAKDLFPAALSKRRTPPRSRPGAGARLPYFVPETKRSDELLEELRSQRLQIAIVLDEYGGVAGLVTLEDLFEEIVGPIDDEHDRPSNGDPVRPLGPSSFEVVHADPRKGVETNATRPASADRR